MVKDLNGKKIRCRCGKHVGTYRKDGFDQMLEDLLGPGGGDIYKVEYTNDVYRNESGCVVHFPMTDMRYCKGCARKAGLMK